MCIRDRIEAVDAQQVQKEKEHGAGANTMSPTEKHTIDTFEAACKYVSALAAADLLYHFDDDPADCLSAHNLTDEQIEAISHNVAQLVAVDWSKGGYECPFDYMSEFH